MIDLRLETLAGTVSSSFHSRTLLCVLLYSMCLFFKSHKVTMRTPERKSWR